MIGHKRSDQFGLSWLTKKNNNLDCLLKISVTEGTLPNREKNKNKNKKDANLKTTNCINSGFL